MQLGLGECGRLSLSRWELSMESSPLWSLIESTVRECGLGLFDLELPKGPNGALRIFLSVAELGSDSGSDSGTDTEKNVTLDQCAMVSKRLDQNPLFEQLLPDGCVVEVSSPGINRKLRRPEHYRGAIGERVKVKFGSEQGEARADSEKVGQPGSVSVVRGKLSAFDGNILEIDLLEAVMPLASAFIYASNHKFQVDVICMEHCTFLKISKSAWLEEMVHNEKLLMNFLTLNSNMTVFLSQKIQMLSLKSLRHKLSVFLLEKTTPEKNYFSEAECPFQF